MNEKVKRRATCRIRGFMVLLKPSVTQRQRKSGMEAKPAARGASVAMGILLMLAGLLAGCVSPQERLDPVLVSSITNGMPRAEVHGVLGEPFGTRKTADGLDGDAYVYGWTLYSQRAGYELCHDLCVRGVVVAYDVNGRVDHVVQADSRVPCETWMHRRGFNKAVAAARRSLQAGKSTRAEVVAELGEPFFEIPHPSGETELIWLNFREGIGDIVRFSGEEYNVWLDPEGFVRETHVQMQAYQWPR